MSFFVEKCKNISILETVTFIHIVNIDDTTLL